MDNIHVVIRVRPLLDKEEVTHWHVNNNTIVQVDSFKAPLCPPYIYDRVFDSTSTSAEVFDEIGIPTLDAVMGGYNGTVFAYGQTASGKTHTMMGTEMNTGLIPKITMALFESIQRTPFRQFLLRVSYMEIYNEKVFDLLTDSRKQLNVREDMNGQTFVENLTEEFVRNSKDVLDIMRRGESNRSYSATNASVHSSRSHTIFRMIIESALLEQDPNASLEVSRSGFSNCVMVSHLNLVDLAGSERAGQSGSSGDRFREGCAINNSLLSLRNVIVKLSQADGTFINYRDSNLTRILKPSLGGNAKTSIICTVTPAMIEETHSTLKFASTAKTIKNKPKINEVLSGEAHLNRCKKEIESLQKELELCKLNDKEKELKLQETSQKNQELTARLKVLNERIITSSLNEQLEVAPINRRETWAFGSILKRQENIKATKNSCVKFDLNISEQKNFTSYWTNESSSSNEDTCKIDSDLNDTIEMMKNQLSTLHKEKLDLNQRLIILDDKLKTEKMRRILAEENISMDNTYCFLEQENIQQEQQIKVLEDQVTNLTKTVHDLEVLTLETKKVHDVVAAEKLKLMNALAEMKEQFSVFKKTEIAKLTQQLQEKHDCVVKYEVQQKQSEILKSELRQELQKAYDHIEQLEKLRHSNDNGLELTTKQKIQEMSELQGKVTEMERGVIEKEDHFKCEVEALQKEVSHYKALASENEKKVNQTAKEVTEMENLISECKKKEALLVDEIAALKLEFDQCKELILHNSLGSSEVLEGPADESEKMTPKPSDVKDINSDYISNQNAIHEAELRVITVEEENSKLKQKIEELASSLEEKECIIMETEELQKELHQYKSMSLEMDKQGKLYVEKISEMQRKQQEMEYLVNEYKTNENDIKENIDRLQLQLVEHNTLISERDLRISNLTAELETTKKQQKYLEECMQEHIQKNKIQLEELEGLKVELKQQDIQRKKEDDFQREITEYQQREKKLKQYVQSLELDVQQKNDVQFNLGEVLKELDSFKQREDKYKNQIKQQSIEMQQFKQLCEETKEKNISTEEQLKQEVYTLQKSEQFLQNYILDLQDREVETEKKLQQEIEHKQSLKNRLEENDKLYAKEIEKLNFTLLDLQEELRIAKRYGQDNNLNVTFQNISKVEFPMEYSLLDNTCKEHVINHIHTETNVHSASPMMLPKEIQCMLLDGDKYNSSNHTNRKSMKDACCLTEENMVNASLVLKFNKGIQCEIHTAKVCKSVQCMDSFEDHSKKIKSPVMLSRSMQCVLLDASNSETNSQDRKTFEDASLSTEDNVNRHVSVVTFTKGLQCELLSAPLNLQPTDSDLDASHKRESEIMLLKKEIETLQEYRATISRNYDELQVDHSILQKQVKQLTQQRKQLENELDISKANNGLNCNCSLAERDIKYNDESVVKLTKSIQCELWPATLNSLNHQTSKDILEISSKSESELKSLKEENKEMKEYNAMLIKNYGELRMDHSLLQHLVTELKQQLRHLESELDVSKAENESFRYHPSTPQDKKWDSTLRKALGERAIAINDMEKVKNELDTLKANYEKLQEEMSLKVNELYHALKTNSEDKKKYTHKVSSLEEEVEYFKDYCEQLKSEIRRLTNCLTNSTMISEIPTKETTALTTDSGCDTKYTEQCSSGSGAVTRYTVDALKAQFAQLEKDHAKLKKTNAKLLQKIEHYRIRIKKMSLSKEIVSPTENMPPPDAPKEALVPHKTMYHTPEKIPAAPTHLKEINLPIPAKPSLASGSAIRSLGKSEDFFDSNLTFSSLDKNLDCFERNQNCKVS